MGKRKLVRRKVHPRMKPEPEFGKGQWRWACFWWFLDQFPDDALNRLRREVVADRVYFGGHYASHAPDAYHPGPLCAALPPRKCDEFLAEWHRPMGRNGKTLAAMMDRLWKGEGVDEVAVSFDDPTWEGGMSEALVCGGKSEFLKAIDGVLAER